MSRVGAGSTLAPALHSGGAMATGHGRDERGIALPMSLMTLLLVSTLSLAFLSLAQSEPVIASNHLRAARARSLAESGIERALWALTHATAPGGFGGAGAEPNVTIAAVAVPPYDGSALLAVGAGGGFHLTITGADPNARVVRAVGWTPTSDPHDPRIRSRSQAIATLARVPNLARDAPCALCAGAALALGGALADARGSETTDCGPKTGAAASSVALDATSATAGAGAPAGPPENVAGRDWAASRPAGALLSAEDLDSLRALAVVRGTYLRPASSARLEPVGLPSGLVFVDTPAGTNALDAANRAVVAVARDFGADLPFRGWLVVNGDVVLAGGADVDGLVYAANGLAAEGAATVTGLVVAAQALPDAAAAPAGLAVRFSCAGARGHGLLPSGWFVRAGTFCEDPTGC